jgi:hypothetical protein
MNPGLRTDCEGFHRRDFLKLGSAGLLGMTLPDLLRLEARGATSGKGKARGVIMVWLAGGPSTIDMWDLKPEAPETIRGEFKPLRTNVAGIEISEHLPQMAEVMDQCTIVRSLYHNIGAHNLGTVYMTTGNRPSAALKYPVLGSLTARLLDTPAGVPPYVSMTRVRDQSPGYLGTAYSPFEVQGTPGRGEMRVEGISLPRGFSLEDLERRNQLVNVLDRQFQKIDQGADIAAGLDQFHQQALDILRSNRAKEAFDLEAEDPRVRDRYGRDPFGQGALAARRLIEAGVRFVTIGTGGWDTHNKNFDSLKTRLLPPVDRTLSALIRDLKDRGMLDSTIVYCAGEFNRTPKINKRAGRDHWGRSLAVLLAGGGLRRGYAHGTTDAHGMVPALEPCTPDDICATLFHCLGLEPHQELMTQTGRPIALFRQGKIVEKLLA